MLVQFTITSWPVLLFFPCPSAVCSPPHIHWASFEITSLPCHLNARNLSKASRLTPRKSPVLAHQVWAPKTSGTTISFRPHWLLTRQPLLFLELAGYSSAWAFPVSSYIIPDLVEVFYKLFSCSTLFCLMSTVIALKIDPLSDTQYNTVNCSHIIAH